MSKKESPQKTTKHDCVHCNAAFKADLTANAYHNAVVSTPATLTLDRTISYKSVNPIKTLYLNGPPGPVYVVPLYIQLHTLRI